MSINAISLDSGRRPLCTVSFTITRCGRTFGDAATGCNAVGDNPCWKTRNFLSDCTSVSAAGVYDFNQAANFIYNFCHEDDKIYSENSDAYYPLLVQEDTAPSKIPRKGGLADISKVTLTFKDAPDPDSLYDDNVEDRNYIPINQGTFWGKFKARHPFIEGTSITIKKGYQNADALGGQVTSWRYVIDSVSYPDANGFVKIICKDPMRLLDAKKEKYPAPNDGGLTTALDETETTSIILDDFTGYSTATTYVRINEEIILVAHDTGSTFSITTRGVLGSTAQAHEVGDVVQQCGYADNLAAVDVLNFLFLNAGIPFTNLDYTGWTTELSLYRAEYTVTNLISEPTETGKLIAELCEELQINIWWDAQANKVRLNAIRPFIAETVLTLDDTQHIKNLQITELEQERLTYATVYTNITDYTKENQFKYFKNGTTYTDTVYFDLFDSIKSKIIFSRWLESTSVALATATTLVNRFRLTPFLVKFNLDPKDFRVSTQSTSDEQARGITTGDHFKIRSDRFQMPDGSSFDPEFICMSCDYDYKRQIVRVEAVQYSISTGMTGLLAPDLAGIPAGDQNYPPDDDAYLDYVYLAGDNGLLSDGSSGYELL